jgi:hypothetical protein
MRAAKLSLSTALVWAALGSGALAQEWASPFRHLPDNTMAVAHVRVDALMKSEFGKAVLAELLGKKDAKESFAKLKTDLGLDSLEVEGLTFLLLDPVPSDGPSERATPRFMLPSRTPFGPPPVYELPIVPAPKSAPRDLNPVSAPAEGLVSVYAGVGNEFVPVVIVTTRKAIDRKQFVRKKVDANLDGRSSLGILFLSDHAIAVGPDYAVVQFAANTSDKESELGKQLSQQNSQAMIHGGFRLAPPMKKALQTEAAGAGPLSLVFPLVNVNHATFSLDVGKPLELKVRLQAANDRQANLAAQSVKTLLAMAEVTLEKLAPEIDKDARDANDARARNKANDAAAILKALRQAASTAQVDQRLTDVSVGMQLDLSAKLVVPLLQEFLPRESGPVFGATSQH